MTHEDTQAVKEILGFFDSIHCHKNSHIVIGGDQSRALYFLKSGTIEVSYTSQNTKIVVALIGPGSFFGEIGFFDEISRVRDIQVTQESEILTLDKDDLKNIQTHNPVLYGNFMAYLARSICSKFRRILGESNPLAGYAASLSTGQRKIGDSPTLPDDFFNTQEGQWIKKLVDEFKSNLFDLSLSIQKNDNQGIPEDLTAKGYHLLNRFHDWLKTEGPTIEQSANKDIIWGYIFKEAFPYFMRSRYLERSYFKPKGYAGDCNMIEMIYDNAPDGDGKIGRLIDQWSLDSVSCKAVRGRRKLLTGYMKTLCAPKKDGPEPIHIMSLACGPSRELCDFLSQCDYSDKIEVLCVDIDPEALEMSAKNTRTVNHNANIRFMNENLIKWAFGKVDQEFGTMDIIYSAGLLDYLDDKLFTAFVTRCYKHLKPGGHLIVGNFKSGPDRIFMDHILDWKLIYREESDFKRLFGRTPFGKDITITAEKQGVNLFSLATR